jgi:hypothetical protein
MSTMPAVIVRKGGFLSSLFSGLFGFLIAVVVCASGLGFYALHMVDSKVDGLFTITRDVISGLPEWQRNLPPLVAEMLDDRRAPDYRDDVEITVQMAPSPDDSTREVTVVRVANNGSETITVLALNVVLENANGVPVSERRVYAATPITVDEDDWRGPLLPGESRRFVVGCHGRCRVDQIGGLEASVGVSELRIWNGPHAQQPETSDGGHAVVEGRPAAAVRRIPQRLACSGGRFQGDVAGQFSRRSRSDYSTLFLRPEITHQYSRQR